MGEPWYKKGKDGLDDDIENSQKRDFGIKRFWVPKGASKTIVFLDDEAFRFWEHNISIDGSWRNFFVCLKKNMQEDCPLCNTDNNPYFVGFYTVIDKTGYRDKSGKEHKNEKVLFPAKPQILEKLKKKSDQKKGLVGCVFEVTRGSGPKSSNVGDDFDFVEKSELSTDFPDMDITPYKYEEIFKPMTSEQLMKVVAKSKSDVAEADAVPY